VAERTVSLEPLAAGRAQPASLWNPTYLLVIAAHFFNYSNRMLLDPVWPLYMLSLGFTPSTIGVTLAVYSTASFLTRPFVGVAVDRWSPRGVNMVGAFSLGVAVISYLAAHLPVLVLGRAVHGFGWAAINTAGATIASESTPAHRRGEAIGYLNMAPSFSTAILPAVGLWLAAAYGFQWVFLLAALFAALALSATFLIRERHRQPAPRTDDSFWSRLIEPRVALPAGLLVLVNFSYLILTVFVVLVARERKIEGLSLFFLVIGLAMVAGSGLNRLSDRWGRKPLIATCLMLATAGMVLLLLASDLLLLSLGGLVAGTGVGLAHSGLMTYAVDLAAPGRRGAALATYTAAFQVGTGAAGLLWGVVVEWWGVEPMFLGAIGLLLAGLVVLSLNWRSSPRSEPADLAR
jgi:predicted MFS family arabinose efflux permease